MLIYITTQYVENYGTEQEPYWKYKGGDDYLVTVDGFKFMDVFAGKNAEMIVDSMRERLEYNNPFSKEYIIGWEFVEDNFQTTLELFQLEQDGEITCPAKRINYDEFMKEVA